MHQYKLASESIFLTVQGEGRLLGIPMVFIRLAGCSVGCSECDTNYQYDHMLDAKEIAHKAINIAGDAKWCWVTGGEPTDQPLGELVQQLRCAFPHVAIATSGIRKKTKDGWCLNSGTKIGGPDFVSVSPHSWGKLKIRVGEQVNVVPGLNGLVLDEQSAKLCKNFLTKWVTPLYGNAESLRFCQEWVLKHPEWRLGIQAHKQWGMQ